MKIKIDFVTNSSTTSFCIIGTGWDDCQEDVAKVFREYLKTHCEQLKVSNPDDIDDWDSYEVFDAVSDLLENVQFYCGEESEVLYMGRDIHKIEYFETIGSVREHVASELRKTGLTVTKNAMGICEEAWRDG